MDFDLTTNKKKKTDEFVIHGTFSVRVKSNKPKKQLKKIVAQNAPHVRNMIIILRDKLYKASKTDDFSKEIYSYFCSSETLREAIYERKGKKDLEKIKKIEHYFKNDAIWHALKKFAKEYLDAKTTFSIIKELNKNYKESAKRIKEYNENKANYLEHYKTKGAPSIPKTKKLKKVNQASVMLDGERWSCKKRIIKTKENGRIVKKIHNLIRIKMGNKETLIPVNYDHFPIPKDCVLRSLNVSHSNSAIYLNFSYGKMEKIAQKIKTIPKKKKKLEASMDLGLKLLFSIFVNDNKTASFAFNNSKMIGYNCSFNRFIAKLDKSIAKEAVKHKEIKRKVTDINGDFILDNDLKPIEETAKIAIEWSKRGEYLKTYRQFLFEKRSRFFKSEYEKLSTYLAKKLIKLGVTDFVISKNLSFLKMQDNKSKMHKKTQQKFYQIPMGEFLNMLERKLKNEMNVHFIDESHTSKTSCLSVDVNEMKVLRLKREKSLSTNDYGGSRVKRGYFHDYRTGVRFHADVNGAVNHLKVKFSELDFSWLTKQKHKICNPKIFKESGFFASFEA